ncbi:2-dehydropantoate 2-reductase [Scheffersomyces xylosifermentans]|uniref:2-dehydropantoate 2-reductase n=1 Tax=Scheffersomyces xylosifermentans TaxID=1304137 RepID=UPI00315DBB0A
MQKEYILGAGSMGCLLAHELSQAFPKQVQPILLFRNQSRLNQFRADGSQVRVIRRKDSNVSTTTSILDSDRQPPFKDGKKQTIENLIVSTKTHSTIKAIDPYIDHLTANSSILILQNGMGMAQRLTERFWPTLKDRPKIFQAISSHGAYKSAPSDIHFVAPGKLSISYIPKPDEDSPDVECPEAFKYILETESLNASYLKYEDFLLIQMEKLVVNACINPLSAILDCFNGQLLYGTNMVPIYKRVIREAVDVFEAEFKELKKIPQANAVLGKERLLETVLTMNKATAQNSSSMREDVKHLAQTEVDWINGYIVDLGTKHGISTPTNIMLVDLVKSKLSIDQSIEQEAAKLVVE